MFIILLAEQFFIFGNAHVHVAYSNNIGIFFSCSYAIASDI